MNIQNQKCTRRSLGARPFAAGGELNGLALKRQTAQSSSALKGRGRRAPHGGGKGVGAEEYADRPGWGGGRQMGLDTPTIQGGEAAPDATILVAVCLAHRHGHALRAYEVTQKKKSAPTCRLSSWSWYQSSWDNAKKEDRPTKGQKR